MSLKMDCDTSSASCGDRTCRIAAEQTKFRCRLTSVAKASSEFRPAYSFNKSKSLVVIFTSISPRASEIRQNFEGKTVILRPVSSWLYFPAFVAHFEADMKRHGFNSVLG